MTRIRSLMLLTAFILWEMNIKGRPVRRFISLSTLKRLNWVITSRLEVISSHIKSSGSTSSARHMLIRCLSPPLSWAGKLVKSSGVSIIISRYFSIFSCRRALSGQPLYFSVSWSVSPMVMVGSIDERLS